MFAVCLHALGLLRRNRFVVVLAAAVALVAVGGGRAGGGRVGVGRGPATVVLVFLALVVSSGSCAALLVTDASVIALAPCCRVWPRRRRWRWRALAQAIV